MSDQIRLPRAISDISELNTMTGDLISRQAAIDALNKLADIKYTHMPYYGYYLGALHDAANDIKALPSVQPEIIRCQECKHNPKYEWFGCPMSHLSEAQRPETAWCWKAERRTE